MNRPFNWCLNYNCKHNSQANTAKVNCISLSLKRNRKWNLHGSNSGGKWVRLGTVCRAVNMKKSRRSRSIYKIAVFSGHLRIVKQQTTFTWEVFRYCHKKPMLTVNLSVSSNMLLHRFNLVLRWQIVLAYTLCSHVHMHEFTSCNLNLANDCQCNIIFTLLWRYMFVMLWVYDIVTSLWVQSNRVQLSSFSPNVT